MSSTAVAPVPAARRVPSCGRRAVPRPGPILLSLLVAMPLSLAMSWGSVVAVWTTGDFVNTDDAMRAVQIRDWMAGQPWFDLAAHRFGLPPGVFSHWSRVVDVPVAALIRLFGLALAPEMAERAARIAYPLALQATLVAAMGYAARVLAGAAAVVPAGLLVVLGGIGCMQFEPGRIHHHSLQIVLLTLMAGTAIDALDPARARRAALTAALVALSLAIGLENLPFVAVVLAVPALAWAVAGAPQRRALLWFAGGLAVSVPAVFAATVAPSRYGLSFVDALSLMHVAGLVGGAAVLALAARLTPHLRTARARWAVLAGAGAALGGTVVLLFPEALHGPFYGMDPLLRPFWLDEVQEVRPLLRLAREVPGTVTILMAPMAVGGLFAILACARTHGLARARWAALVALLLVGFAGSVWAIRVASSLQPLALLGGAWAVGRAWTDAHRDGRVAALWRPAVRAALCSSVAWALLPWPAAAIVGGERGPSCLAASALAPLAALPPGTVFAPIDSGPLILAHTGLSVLAGPYHRDNAGNRAVIEGFLAEPEVARALVRATGARYLAVCGEQTGLESAAAPAGLAASLRDGHVPAWLEPLHIGPTLFRVYAVH